MNEYKEGDVVIVRTGQAGTVYWILPEEVCVLLRNGDIWYGTPYDVRRPSNKKELKACPIDVDRWNR